MDKNPHIASRFDKDLGKIKDRILEMGDQVILQLVDSTDALGNFDAGNVDRLIANDRKINGMNKDIYTRSETLIARRQPMALDLRQALSPINIAGELERIGDHAKSTAKRARKLQGSTAGEDLREVIQDMSAMVQGMLADALRAYQTSDIDLAADVRMRDQTLDHMNRDVFTSGVKSTTQTPENAEIFIHLILLARTFERVGDHVANMARHVHQIVTGEDLKASE